MTAVSNVSIANRALTKIGEGRITSLAQASESARVLNACFEQVRDAELRRRKWRFALARVSLAALADAPAFGYTRQFQLPSDCLRVWSVGEIATGAFPDQLYTSLDAEDYAIEGRVILTDLDAPLAIRYTQRVTDPVQFDAAFVEALAARLAYEIASSLGKAGSDRDDALRDYKMALAEAVHANAIEAGAQVIPDDSWLLARA